MSNEELYKQLEEDFLEKDLEIFSMIEALKEAILFMEDKENNNLPSEHQYNMKWWNDKHIEISNTASI